MSKYKREKSQIIEIEEEISILVKKKSAIGVSIYNQWIFLLEFIYKLHVLKISMKPNPTTPWNPNCLLTEKNESKKTKRISSEQQRNLNLASKN